MKNVKFGSKEINHSSKVLIVFELGPTHRGYQSAKKLIKAAAKSGADAVKFQIFNAEKLVSDKNQIFQYEILKNKNTNQLIKKKKSLFKILKERMLNNREWIKLKKYCDTLGLIFFATVAFEEDLIFLKKIKCPSIKIASADINHHQLIEKAAKMGFVIQLDTAMATLHELKSAIRVIEKKSNKKIIIHHCPTGYPAKINDININNLIYLKNTFNYPIAFSDHSSGYDIDIMAVTVGAKIIEKTLTENRKFKNPEHAMSIEINEAKKFVLKIKQTETALGKEITNFKINKKNKMMIRRSIFLEQNASKGTKLKNLKIIYRRPGLGIGPDLYNKFKSKKLKYDLSKNYMLKLKDLY